MSAQVIQFPVQRRDSDLAVSRDWLYMMLRSTGQSEQFAREWAETLAPTIKNRPQDIVEMRSELGR